MFWTNEKLSLMVALINNGGKSGISYHEGCEVAWSLQARIKLLFSLPHVLLYLFVLQFGSRSAKEMQTDAGEGENESGFGNDCYADEVAEELALLESVEDEEVVPMPIIVVQPTSLANVHCTVC